MAINYDLLHNPTDSEMVKALRHAITSILTGGQSYTIDGQQLNRANLKDLQDLLVYYENKSNGNNFPKFIPIGKTNIR